MKILARFQLDSFGAGDLNFGAAQGFGVRHGVYAGEFEDQSAGVLPDFFDNQSAGDEGRVTNETDSFQASETVGVAGERIANDFATDAARFAQLGDGDPVGFGGVIRQCLR